MIVYERFIYLYFKKVGEKWGLEFSNTDPRTEEKINLKSILSKPCRELLLELEKKPTEKQLQQAESNAHILYVRAIQQALEKVKEDGGSLFTRGVDDTSVVLFEISRTRPARHGNVLSSLKEPTED